MEVCTLFIIPDHESPSIPGVHSYVVKNKTYCIYLAPSTPDKAMQVALMLRSPTMPCPPAQMRKPSRSMPKCQASQPTALRRSGPSSTPSLAMEQELRDSKRHDFKAMTPLLPHAICRVVSVVTNTRRTHKHSACTQQQHTNRSTWALRPCPLPQLPSPFACNPDTPLLHSHPSPSHPSPLHSTPSKPPRNSTCMHHSQTPFWLPPCALLLPRLWCSRVSLVPALPPGGVC